MYFDNFSTSLRLLNKLRDQGIGATETVRQNRVEKRPLPAPDKMKKRCKRNIPLFARQKQQRHRSSMERQRWKDNSVVTVASNCHDTAPLGQAQRWSYADK